MLPATHPILHRFGDTAVYWSKNRQNRQFVRTPVSEITLARGDPMPVMEYSGEFIFQASSSFSKTVTSQRTR